MKPLIGVVIVPVLLVFVGAQGFDQSIGTGVTTGAESAVSVSDPGIIRICPAALSGCAHTIEVHGKAFRFEGVSDHLRREIKDLLEIEQSPTFSRDLRVHVDGFFVQKSGLWPDMTRTIDILEVTGIHKSLK